MNASELASLLQARRVGKNRWVAKCPAHVPDRNPSLSIAVGKKSPVVFRCMSQGCPPKAILEAMGLSWKDVLGEASDEVKGRMAEEEQERSLRHRLDLVTFLGLIEPHKRNYWRSVYRRLNAEWKPLWCRLNPEECEARVKEMLFQREFKRIGLDAMMEKIKYL